MCRKDHKFKSIFEFLKRIARRPNRINCVTTAAAALAAPAAAAEETIFCDNCSGCSHSSARTQPRTPAQAHTRARRDIERTQSELCSLKNKVNYDRWLGSSFPRCPPVDDIGCSRQRVLCAERGCVPVRITWNNSKFNSLRNLHETEWPFNGSELTKNASDVSDTGVSYHLLYV